MPLPLVDVPEKDPKHLNEYPEYPAGRAVLALFPDTTSFYKAEVVATPKDLRAEGQRVSIDV
jgi:SAGA-associated factor 29